MAVASWAALRSYTVVSTQVASARARIDTQAPGLTKTSAEAAWRGSSRVMSRTRTLVSTARIRFPDPTPDPLLHFIDSVGCGRLLWKQCPMNVFGCGSG